MFFKDVLYYWSNNSFNISTLSRLLMRKNSRLTTKNAQRRRKDGQNNSSCNGASGGGVRLRPTNVHVSPN